MQKLLIVLLGLTGAAVAGCGNADARYVAEVLVNAETAAAEIHTLYSDAHGPLVEKQNELVECPSVYQAPTRSRWGSEAQFVGIRARNALLSCEARVNELQTILAQSQTDIDRYGETFRERIERMRSRLEQETREKIAEIVAEISAVESLNERWEGLYVLSLSPAAQENLMMRSMFGGANPIPTIDVDAVRGRIDQRTEQAERVVSSVHELAEQIIEANELIQAQHEPEP